LTGLRFFLATAVVVFHYGEQLAPRLPWPVRNVLGSGFLAVDVFFLLSGFVMAYNYLGDGGLRGTAGGFWRARAARILPVYWIGMLLFTPLAIARLWHGDAAAFGAAFVSAALLVQAWIPSLAAVWNPPGWSLSVEAVFYAVFPRLGPYLWRLPRPGAALGVCWLLLVASGTLVSWLDPHPPTWPWTANPDSCEWNLTLNFNPLLRVPEFAAGILACRLRWQGWASLAWLLPLFIVGLLVCRTAFNADLVVLGLFLPLLCAWIAVLARTEGWVTRFLSLPVCVRLGEWSYALYILHLPVWGLMLSANQENGELLNPAGVPFLVMTFLVAMGLSAAVHQFVEVPYRKAFLQALRPVESHG
jgi:peptidoglycan/LPS O-acetylase OafA/YrhL